MKKKTLGLLLAGVAAASMIGTGFAAWIITANASETKEGQFQVDTVSEKSLTITPSFAEGEGKINFLAPANATTGWFTNDAENGIVKLSTDLTINYSVTGDANAKASDYKVTYTIAVDADTQSAITAGYITAPTLKIGDSTTVADVALTSTTTTDSVTLTIAFGWGAAFGSQNPYVFYNTFAYGDKVDTTGVAPVADEDGTTTIEVVAKETMEAMEDLLDEAKFTITITAKPVSVA